LTAADLAQRFGVANSLRFEDGPGALVRAIVSTSAADVEIYLQGAHVARWTPRGQQPVLFLSSKAQFAAGKAIRGGIPVIFPWFGARGDGKAGPDHGFARTTEWSIESARPGDGGAFEIIFALAPNNATRALGYDDFHLRLRVTTGAALSMELEVQNRANTPLLYEEALHSYFAVGDVREASVSGLEGTLYIDKTDGFQRKTAGDKPLRIAKETDQVHLNTAATCVVHDPVGERRIVIEKRGSASTVIWNPWSEKTVTMNDMDPDGWKEMLCVETANAADNTVSLLPGASHTLTAVIRLE
jgi:glucose-6-phosphate 1-epimerase